MYGKKDVLKYLYNKLNGNGEIDKLPELMIKIKEIKKINKYYKDNFEKFDNFTEFMNYDKKLFTLINFSKSAIQEIKKQFELKKGLQPSIITECFISQTIANKLGLNNFIDYDDPSAVVPVAISNLLFSFSGFRDNSSFRYLYFDDSYKTLLVQCGDSSTIDAVFIKNKVGIRLEFKEEVSKLQELDIRNVYGEDGKLNISKEFIDLYPLYVPFLELFNHNTDVFSMEGHNFEISKYLDEVNTNNIIETLLDTKSIDLYVLLLGNKIYPVISNYLIENVNLDNSEIRTAGRNFRNLFTPEYAIKVINKEKGIIKGEIVEMEYDSKKETIGRGLSKITRYKLSPLIFVPFNKVSLLGSKVYFNFNDIKQLVPSISIHLNAKFNLNSCIKQTLSLVR